MNPRIKYISYVGSSLTPLWLGVTLVSNGRFVALALINLEQYGCCPWCWSKEAGLQRGSCVEPLQSYVLQQPFVLYRTMSVCVNTMCGCVSCKGRPKIYLFICLFFAPWPITTMLHWRSAYGHRNNDCNLKRPHYVSGSVPTQNKQFCELLILVDKL